ncbi:hypothetical protein PRIPAC_72160, partial [Pristionchus pacificus]
HRCKSLTVSLFTFSRLISHLIYCLIPAHTPTLSMPATIETREQNNTNSTSPISSDRAYLKFVTKQLEVEEEEECMNTSCALSDDEQLCDNCCFCADHPSVCQRMVFERCGHAVCRPCAKEIRLVAGDAPVECPSCGEESIIVRAVEELVEEKIDAA